MNLNSRTRSPAATPGSGRWCGSLNRCDKTCYNIRVTFLDPRPILNATDARPDFDIIVNWVAPGARVLDLGCGTGELMERLLRERQAVVQGVDLHQPSITACISKGLSVFHGDLHEGLADLRDGSFDVIVLSRTLQQVPDPDRVIREMLRVGKRAIVSFPNFAYWRLRLHLLLHGTLPVSPALPYAWYNTPNIRLITIVDFEKFCAEQGYAILDHLALNIGTGRHARVVRKFCDLCGEYGMFQLERKQEQCRA